MPKMLGFMPFSPIPDPRMRIYTVSWVTSSLIWGWRLLAWLTAAIYGSSSEMKA
jgi:hypothetical protein